MTTPIWRIISGDNTRNGVFAFSMLALIGLFLLSRPYTGIRHDGILYVAQAFFRIDPEIFANDIFFRFGSQEQFSLFGRIYALVIAQFGVETASISLTLLSQSVFLAVLVVLARRTNEKGLWARAVLFFIASSSVYGGLRVFRVAEPFVTGRPFAEALVLVAVILLLNDRRWISVMCLVAASLLHPLQSLAGWLIWWVWQVQEDRRWLGAMALGIIPLGLGFAGITPFDRLFQTFDPAWREIVEEENAHIFLSQWHWQDALLVLTDASIIALAGLIAGGTIRRLLLATLVVTVLGLGVSVVMGDLLLNVLITGLQPWRALWLTHVVAILVVPMLVKEYWERGNIGKLATSLLVFAVTLRGLPSAAGAMVLAIALLGPLRRWQISKAVLFAAVGALAAGAFAQWIYNVHTFAKITDLRFHVADIDLVRRFYTHPLPLLGVGAIALHALSQHKYRIPSFVLVSLALLLSVATWDQRSPWSLVTEGSVAGQHPFVKHVPKSASLLWYEEPTAPWLLLRRQSYLSRHQSAGQVFSRETAMEIHRRRKAIAIFGFQKELCEIMNSLNNRSDSCIPNTDAVREACRNAVDLDFIVVPGELSVPAEAHWHLNPEGSRWQEDYYLYECGKIAPRIAAR